MKTILYYHENDDLFYINHYLDLIDRDNDCRVSARSTCLSVATVPPDYTGHTPPILGCHQQIFVTCTDVNTPLSTNSTDVDGINFHKLPENITHVGAGPEIWRAIGIQLLVWVVVRKFELVLKLLSSGTKISQLQVHRLNKFRLLEFFFNFCEHDGEMMFIWRLSTAVYRDL